MDIIYYRRLLKKSIFEARVHKLSLDLKYKRPRFICGWSIGYMTLEVVYFLETRIVRSK